MIKIKQNTWHFWCYEQSRFFLRRGRWFRVPERPNLCSYARGVMLGLLKWPVVAVVSPVIALMWLLIKEVRGLPVLLWLVLLFFFGMMVYANIRGFIIRGFIHHPAGFAIAHGIIIGIILLIVGIVFFRTSDTTILIRQWLAAKKQKVCPLVEFENE